MKTFLAPKYVRGIGDVNILWFQTTHNFVVLDTTILSLLNTYLKSAHKNDFINTLRNEYGLSRKLAINYLVEFSQLLESKQFQTKTKLPIKESLNSPVDNLITKYYKIDDSIIQINYSSHKVATLIHPQLEYAQIPKNRLKPKVNFSIINQNKTLTLFENNELIASFNQKNYHLLQGKFNMRLLCFNTNKNEEDWIGSFHASTVSNGKKSIMLIGKSGSGKSTLSALLMTNGFELVADDITSISAENLHTYKFPAAISLKEGGFNTITKTKGNKKALPSYFLNPKKGALRFLPPSINYSFKHYPCNQIVLVEYNPNAQTKLSIMKIADALNILIPESWISSKNNNVLRFLDWINTVEVYKLSYSDNSEAVAIFSELFN